MKAISEDQMANVFYRNNVHKVFMRFVTKFMKLFWFFKFQNVEKMQFIQIAVSADVKTHAKILNSHLYVDQLDVPPDVTVLKDTLKTLTTNVFSRKIVQQVSSKWNKKVILSNLILAECGANQHYEKCGVNGCQNTCEQPELEKVCLNKRCQEGCYCDEGYIRRSDGECVLPEQCSQSMNY